MISPAAKREALAQSVVDGRCPRSRLEDLPPADRTEILLAVQRLEAAKDERRRKRKASKLARRRARG